MNNTAKQIILQKDEVLFEQGQHGDCAYVVESGRVLVYIVKEGKEIPLAIIKKGEIFGEMSLLDHLPRSASVKAIEPAVLNTVTKEQLLERYQNSDELVRLLLQVMINRVRRNNFTLLNSSMGPSHDSIEENSAETTNVFDNIKLENRLNDALNNQEFEMFYQPIVEMDDHRIVGCEALIRWKDPKLGYIQPDKFIDFLENSSLMISVGYWIFERCFQDLKVIKQQFGDEFIMSINVSGRQFAHPDFLFKLEQFTWKHKVSPKNIKLEVTERVMMDGINANEVLNACKDKGFQISIDDFGTGFSSLQYLSQMPVNYLKIDKSFVSQIEKDQKVFAVVKSMVFMAKALGMEIIAEGVETNNEREKLLGLDAHYCQGWYYSKAVPLNQFVQLPFVFVPKKPEPKAA